MYLTKNKTERCVMARITRHRKLYQANFTLREYGNWQAAMAAAQKWINNLVKNLPAPLTRKDIMTGQNTSGVVGVHKHRAIRKRRGRPNVIYRSWVAWWPDCKIRGRVKWPVKRHGEDDAFVLAVLCRRLETPVRAKVLEELKWTRRTAEYHNILKLKKGRRAKLPAFEPPPEPPPENFSDVPPSA